MRLLRPIKNILCCFLLVFFGSAEAFSTGARVTAAVLRDHSQDAINLFNNMRTPAALLTGGLVPLGIISAPKVQKDDDCYVKILKKASILLSAVSLLSEIIAVTYSSIAINKLVELPSPPTVGVAELIKKNHEMAWLGTNIHFLIGMMGFGLLVGSRVFLAFGNPVGRLAMGFSVSFFLQALSIVNKGISMGSTNDMGVNVNFAANFFGLVSRYACCVAKNSTGGICSMASVAIMIVTAVQAVKVFYKAATDEAENS